jgi:hypothetical protein
VPPKAADCVVSNGRTIRDVDGSDHGLIYGSFRILRNYRLQSRQPTSEPNRHSNEHSGSIKDKSIFYHLNWQLRRKDCAVCSTGEIKVRCTEETELIIPLIS